MGSHRTHCYSDAQAFATGLEELRRIGITPRGLLFAALAPSGAALVVVPSNPDEVTRIKVGEKLALHWPHDGRHFHFDSVHRLRAGQFVYNGDRRLQHPGDAPDCAGALANFLKGAGARSVFFGCTPHQPGSWLVSRRVTAALHDRGFVDVVPIGDALLARRLIDHRLWLLEVGERLESYRAVFESPLGNVLMLERRIVADRLVLSCEGGLVEVDVSQASAVVERARVPLSGGVGVVGRIDGGAYAVTRGTPQPWGLDEIGPATLIGAAGSLFEVGAALIAESSG